MEKQYKSIPLKNRIKYSAIKYSVALLATLSVIACGNSEQRNSTIADSINSSNHDITNSSNQDLTSGISFKDKDGKTVMLSSLKGKVVFINFWALWCPPCIQEIPSIDKLKRSFEGNKEIIFLMVDVDNKIEKSMTYMKDNNFDLSVYVPNSDIPAEFLGNAIPTTVILDKSGDMIEHLEGGRDYSSNEMIKIIKELVESE